MRRMLIVVTAAAVVMTLGPLSTHAYADRAVARDAVHDVVMGEDELVEGGPAPDQAQADIVRTVVRHGARRLVIKVKVQDLTFGRFRAVYASVRTHRAEHDLTVFALDKVKDFTFSSSRGVPCPGRRMSYSVRKDTVTMSVPRRCLSNAEWVRVGTLLSTSEAGGGRVTYADDGLLAGRIKVTGVAHGARVYAG